MDKSRSLRGGDAVASGEVEIIIYMGSVVVRGRKVDKKLS